MFCTDELVFPSGKFGVLEPFRFLVNLCRDPGKFFYVGKDFSGRLLMSIIMT